MVKLKTLKVAKELLKKLIPKTYQKRVIKILILNTPFIKMKVTNLEKIFKETLVNKLKPNLQVNKKLFRAKIQYKTMITKY